MGKILLSTIVLLATACFKTPVKAQCTVSVSGDQCITSVLTANFSGDAPDTVKWYKDDILQQVKTKRNPLATVVAGGGVGEAGQLFEPEDIFVDAAGNIYIVDNSRQRVQKWAPGAATGITVAGGNGKGNQLNQLFTPRGIAVDKAGNVYVSDDVLTRVTKWAPGAASGVIVAGGNGEGSAANQLAGPQNICLDKAGNIYIADRWNDRIQKWAPGAANGVTVAGGNGRGSAADQFYEPLDVDVDAAGNVYVVDYYNSRVQKWAPGATTGATVAGGNGTGAAANQLSFTTALRVLPNGTIFVRDQGNYRIQKWVPGADYGVTVAGGNGTGDGLNKIGSGFGVFADKTENIYVPELFLNTVNKFIPSVTADMQFTVTTPGAYVVSVKAKKVCSAKSPKFKVETIPAKPERIFGPKSVAVSQAGLVYYVQKNIGHTYTWSVPPDAVIMHGQGTFRIRVNWGASNGTITVFESGPCGVSPLKKKNILISEAIADANMDNRSEKQVTAKDISIYPNPVKTGANLRFSSGVSISVNIEVTDLTGKLLSSNKYLARRGTNSYYINMDKLTPGIYLIRIRSVGNETHVFKCVKM